MALTYIVFKVFFFFFKADDSLPLFPYLMWRYIQKIQNFFSNFFTLHRKTCIESNSKVCEKNRKYQTLLTYFQSFLTCICWITSVKNTKTKKKLQVFIGWLLQIIFSCKLSKFDPQKVGLDAVKTKKTHTPQIVCYLTVNKVTVI